MEISPFVDAFPIGKCGFPLLILFTRGWLLRRIRWLKNQLSDPIFRKWSDLISGWGYVWKFLKIMGIYKTPQYCWCFRSSPLTSQYLDYSWLFQPFSDVYFDKWDESKVHKCPRKCAKGFVHRIIPRYNIYIYICIYIYILYICTIYIYFLFPDVCFLYIPGKFTWDLHSRHPPEFP